MFAATTPENMPMAYRASTSTNPNPVISPAFVKANYEAFECILRDRRRQRRNNDLRTELEYFSEDYDEEREMEPRPKPTRAATPPLRIASPRIRRRGERIVGFEGAQRAEGKVGSKGILKGEGLQKKHPEEMEVKVGQALPNTIGGNLLSNEKVAKTFEQPPRLPGANWSKDKTRYYHFHEDYGHETNQCRELKHQIEEAVKSGQLAHLVKGVKEKKEKTTGSSDPVIIKVYISGRQANREYLDGGSSCDVIYEHCFLELKPSIRSLRVDSNTPLVGFSREQSWPFGEIPLEVTIGEGPIAVTKTLTFVIVKSDSPHNLLLGRTAMQQMGIVVSTVHGAIKFHTPRGIGTIFLGYRRKDGDKRQVPTTEDYDRETATNKNKNKAMRSLKKIHRRLRMDLDPHNGSAKSNNDWRRNFQYRTSDKGV
ncbi:reverse transcriptase domain-containing protein [Tanacetum coccineum]